MKYSFLLANDNSFIFVSMVSSLRIQLAGSPILWVVGRYCWEWRSMMPGRRSGWRSFTAWMKIAGGRQSRWHRTCCFARLAYVGRGYVEPFQEGTLLLFAFKGQRIAQTVFCDCFRIALNELWWISMEVQFQFSVSLVNVWPVRLKFCHSRHLGLHRVNSTDAGLYLRSLHHSLLVGHRT